MNSLHAITLSPGAIDQIMSGFTVLGMAVVGGFAIAVVIEATKALRRGVRYAVLSVRFRRSYGSSYSTYKRNNRGLGSSEQWQSQAQEAVKQSRPVSE